MWKPHRANEATAAAGGEDEREVGSLGTEGSGGGSPRAGKGDGDREKSTRTPDPLAAHCELSLDMHHPNIHDDVDDEVNDEWRPSLSECSPLHLRRLASSLLPRGDQSYDGRHRGRR